MPAKPDFDAELARLQQGLPKWVARLVKAMSRPRSAFIRVPLALVLTAAGLFGFLPILGFWMTPLGLALLAMDLPVLRRPMARCLAFINRRLIPKAG